MHVLLFTGAIYLSHYHVGPIMDEEERANYEGQIQELSEALVRSNDKPIPGAIRSLERIADALERLLKISEMRP